MVRSRFETLLTCLHFVDNDNADKANRLYKIQPVLDLLNGSFQKMYKPPRELCIDESMVPFRGRVVFKQFNKSKRYKYGIKLFKLCSKGGYTRKVKVYAGKDVTRVGGVPDSVVLNLMEATWIKDGIPAQTAGIQACLWRIPCYSEGPTSLEQSGRT
ncbi:PiggyBac transposable element-derived protein 4 [Trichostrongylus colubriformis]|uniref:PiggyBac transposable element-derived protein 4 n=1 Tax=Trichostrongylus colubriformis TaxID=6319 RepID=A0AAN8FZU5_TRICO